MAQLPLTVRALFFPTRPPQTVAERHWRKFWDQEVAHHAAANFIWQSRLRWAGLRPRSRLIILGLCLLVLIAVGSAGVIIPNLKLKAGLGQPGGFSFGVPAPLGDAGNGASATGIPKPGTVAQSQGTATADTTNLQTLLICGGAVVLAIGGIVIAAQYDERQRKKRSIDRP
jgi:hypothetical protein